MMYKFVLMSRRWYYIEVRGIIEDMEVTEEHIQQGTVVAFCDDIGTFADQMGVEVSDMINEDT